MGKGASHVEGRPRSKPSNRRRNPVVAHRGQRRTPRPRTVRETYPGPRAARGVHRLGRTDPKRRRVADGTTRRPEERMTDSQIPSPPTPYADDLAAARAAAKRILDGAALRLLTEGLDRDAAGSVAGGDGDSGDGRLDQSPPLGDGQSVPVRDRDGKRVARAA